MIRFALKIITLPVLLLSVLVLFVGLVFSYCLCKIVVLLLGLWKQKKKETNPVTWLDVMSNANTQKGFDKEIHSLLDQAKKAASDLEAMTEAVVYSKKKR